MSAALVQGLLAGYGIAVPVGAIGVLLIQLSATSTTGTACAAALGVAAADGLYAIVALLAGAGLAPLLAPAVTPMRWVAAVVLLVVAIRTVIAAWRDSTGTQAMLGMHTPRRAFGGFLGLTLLNPATVIYFVALLLGRQHAHPSTMDSVVFVAAAFAASASWQLLLATAGRLLGAFLTGARGRRYSATAASTIIVVLAAALVLG